MKKALNFALNKHTLILILQERERLRKEAEEMAEKRGRAAEKQVKLARVCAIQIGFQIGSHIRMHTPTHIYIVFHTHTHTHTHTHVQAKDQLESDLRAFERTDIERRKRALEHPTTRVIQVCRSFALLVFVICLFVLFCLFCFVCFVLFVSVFSQTPLQFPVYVEPSPGNYQTQVRQAAEANKQKHLEKEFEQIYLEATGKG